jgi:TetR/AcrR family transcriptional regulator, transcriptional repressor for nem operon
VKRGSSTRARVVQTTLDLMWLNGFGSVTVDAICAAAKVQKGSFYHFFRSKLDVAAAALEAHWDSIQPDLERIFSDKTIAPNQRIAQYFDHVYLRQLARSKRVGQVMGCPFVTLGTEVIKHESVVSAKAKELMDRYCLYFETALGEAQEKGDVHVDDVRVKARELYGYLVGGLVQARIRNDAEILKRLSAEVRQTLGIRKPPPKNPKAESAVKPRE